MTDAETKPMKYYSNKQEANLSNILGWKKIGGSGASPCAPGDIKASEWLGECKTHTKQHSIYFDAGVWAKIKDEAFGHNKKPVLFVDDGTQKETHTWCLCLEKNINQSALVSIKLPFTVRKNVTFDHNDAAQFLKEQSKIYVGEFYQGACYWLEWNSDNILIMPFETFKDFYKK